MASQVCALTKTRTFSSNLGTGTKSSGSHNIGSGGDRTARRTRAAAEQSRRRNITSTLKANADGVSFPSFGASSSAAFPTAAGDQPPSWWTQQSGMGEQKTPSAADSNTLSNGKSPRSASCRMDDEDLGHYDNQSNDEQQQHLQQEEDTAKQQHSPRRQSSSSGSQSAEPQQMESEKSMLSLAELYNKQGKELYSIGLYERSLDAYTKCLNYAPPDWIGRATVTGNRAAVNFMMARYIECCDDCEDALRMDPTLVKLHIRKGKALVRLGHLSPAEAAFITADAQFKQKNYSSALQSCVPDSTMEEVD